MKKLETESIEKISVTSLCRECELNRTTFYLHYSDVYAILEEMQEEILTALANMSEKVQSNSMDERQIICFFLSAIRRNREMLRSMLFVCSDEFWNEVKKQVYKLFLYQTSVRHPGLKLSKQELEDIIKFLNNGYWVTYRDWILNDCKEEIDYIADYLLAVSTNCMNGL